MSIYTYKPSITAPNGIPPPGYNNEATILVENSSKYYTVVGTSYNNLNGSFEGFIVPQSYDISLVFQTTPPSIITEIYNKAFLNCLGLRFVTLPPSLKTISSSAFAIPDGSPVPANHGLLDLSFTDIANSELQSIANQAFANQANLSSITLPASVKSIGQMAFNDCGGLTSLLFHDISNSVLQLIDTQAFQYTALTSVILPASLETIGPGAFSQVATTLTSVTFYDIALSRLDTIDSDAFAGANITTITIPNNIQSIGSSAFFGGDGMTVKMNSKAAAVLDVTVPQSGVGVTFRGATNVTIEADENTYEYTPGTSVPTAAPPSGYGGEQTILVNNSPGTSVPVSAFEGLIITAYGPAALVFANGSTTKSIGDDAFKNCTGLKHATIPDSIITIGTNAFTGSGLQRVYISRKTAAVLGVTITQNATFFGATGVTIVEYPPPPPPPSRYHFSISKN